MDYTESDDYDEFAQENAANGDSVFGKLHKIDRIADVYKFEQEQSKYDRQMFSEPYWKSKDADYLPDDSGMNVGDLDESQSH